jgi:hypothetical protein
MHAMLRLGVGVTASFLLCESLQWTPTFLAPVLFAFLLTNIPFCPPPKAGVALVLAMTLAATTAFILSSALAHAPQILTGAIGLIVFASFSLMARGRAKLPAIFMLLCIALIPVITMVAPAQAGVLPWAMVRGVTIAVLLLYGTYAIWPTVVPPAPPPPAADVASPTKTALLVTAIVMPLILAFLMFGLTDALPVLSTSILLVATFETQRGAMQGLAMIVGNLKGGFVGVLAFLALAIFPSLTTLSLITFAIALMFALQVDKGGATGAIAVISLNTYLIILSTALASGPTSSGIWVVRVMQFVLASLFAVGMMSLFWPKRRRAA